MLTLTAPLSLTEQNISLFRHKT